MDITIYIVTLVGTGLVLAAAFTSLIAFRFGAPLLLVFLLIGMIAGTDGFGIDFDNARLAYFVGSLALAIILFESGFGTPLRTFRQAAAPALTLATIGVILTAAFMGVAAHFLIGLGWPQSFLIGAIVGSTDAAAVFFLLRTGNVAIRDRIRSTLEIESGSNDPMAIFLTLSLVTAISAAGEIGPQALASEIAVGFVQQMGLGVALGLAGGWAITWLVGISPLERGLVPVFVIALAMMVFSSTGALGGSGFLAVYLAGIIAGNRMSATGPLQRFQEGMSWLAQIIMFLVLGLFATPSQFPSLIGFALALALFLMFVARPLAVTLCLIPFRFTRAETAFMSWVGLRGSVSILLALTPLIGDIESGRTLFNIAFIIVMVSLLVQGWTIVPLARRLDLVVPPRMGPLAKHELDLPGAANHELLAYRVTAESPVAQGSRIPRWARPALVVRGKRSMSFQYAGHLREGDYVYIFVPNTYPRLLDRLFASPAAIPAGDIDFFGAFAVDPGQSAAVLDETYDLGLSGAERKLTIAQLMIGRLGGRAEYADRVPLGPLELIVRDTDENNAIVSVGLAVETHPAPSIPPYLSFAELTDRLRAAYAARKARRAQNVSDDAPAGGDDETPDGDQGPGASKA